MELELLPILRDLERPRMIEVDRGVLVRGKKLRKPYRVGGKLHMPANFRAIGSFIRQNERRKQIDGDIDLPARVSDLRQMRITLLAGRIGTDRHNIRSKFRC